MRSISCTFAAALSLVLAGCARRAPEASLDPVAAIAQGFDAGIRRDIETLRRATMPYHDLTAAEAAGYPTAMPLCVADPAMGGMGHHLVDRKLFDDRLEIARPEMLIYAPDGDGGVELVAVEYVVPFSALPPTAKPPRLFGQELKPYTRLNYWALHVWAWRRNEAGLFADWNPAVKC